MSLFRFVQWISERRPVTVYGDGYQSRDFTFVDDIARGTIATLNLVGYHVINLGSNQPVVLNDAIHMVEEELQETAIIDFQPLHTADVVATWADIGKAKRLIQWEPEISTAEGIHNLVCWYQANQEWAKNILTSSEDLPAVATEIGQSQEAFMPFPAAAVPTTNALSSQHHRLA